MEINQVWETANLLALGAVQVSDQALTALDAPSVKQTVVLKQSGSTLMTLETKPGGFSTMTLATGSERKLDPQTWAESLTKQFDAIKGAQKYKQLAEQLGTDTKTVCAQMALAQKIIHDAAELEEAEAVVNAWTEKINYLQGIKTTSKEGLFVTTTIVSGGVSLSALSTCVSTLGEAGVVVVGGADCIVDVATTGSTIILGENHQVTVGLNDVKDKLAPVTAVTGLLTFEPAKLGSVTEKTGEQLSYIGDSLADLFYKGKILGIKVVHEKNGKTISAQVMEAAGQDVASLEAVLKAAGFFCTWKQ